MIRRSRSRSRESNSRRYNRGPSYSPVSSEEYRDRRDKAGYDYRRDADRRRQHRDREEHRKEESSTRSSRRQLSTSPISDVERVGSNENTATSPTTSVHDDRLERLEKMVELLVSQNAVLREKALEMSPVPNGNHIQEFIPRNSNFTTSMWLNRIQDEAINQNFDEGQTIQFMASKMTGVMKAWYNSVASYNFSWPELKLLIVKTFPDHRDFAVTLKVLVNRKKEFDETWTNYFFSKLYLLEACKITGTNAVSCIIDGLNHHFMQQEAKENNYLTPESLYSMYLTKFPDYDANLQEHQDVAEYEEPYEPSPHVLHPPVEDCRRKLEKKKRFSRWK